MSSILSWLSCLGGRKKGPKKIKEGEYESKETNGSDGGGRSMSELPYEIIVNILSRFPVKTIFACRCVCKTWHALLSDPYFSKMRKSIAPITFFINGVSNNGREHCYYLAELEPCTIGSALKFQSYSNANLYIGNSCNGLLCLRKSVFENLIYVYNPLLGESITLRQRRRKNLFNTYYGPWLGFNPKTNEYKVIQFERPYTGGANMRNMEVHIYTLGSSTAWRSIGYAPYLLHRECSTFLHGNLHWGILDENNSDFICCFDIGDESFGTIPPPPHFKEKLSCRYYMCLGDLGGYLYVSTGFRSHGNWFDIWVMKDYGVKESWTKEFSIKKSIFAGPSWNSYQPIGCMSNGRILILCDHEKLVSYNPLTRSFRNFKVPGIHILFPVYAHVPSFVSLKDAVKGESLTVLNEKI